MRPRHDEEGCHCTVLQLACLHPAVPHPCMHAWGAMLTNTYSSRPHRHSKLWISCLLSCLLTYRKVPARWHSSQGHCTANSTRISEGYFCSAAGLVLPPWLTGWPAHLVIRDTPTQALCSLGQQLRPPQGWGAATLGVCCPGHTSLKQIEGVKENTFLPSVSMPTASSQVLSVFLCPPCPQQGQP